ncbi:hypothetical protein Deipr_0460 [Deinococcus proteolyticus MRP]|uniref:HNH endonuclease n=1 Tax=Deinococcus proteolyticus (strain ATCC 35074 / DSM 20540 / JCM 6276 / NBRC 101906 / NCIMB 13154 / VKM Ac-1939 / CCM 2703 / MRP) TaxID=693977 RepID=F0RK71_DEIPM|nr:MULTISPECIES: HNH endonuclease [Deinococcus]ADY25630.1 hypothetical protein Deipr_0460 [Deinococcus proteolyticus MRP]MCY1701748.1 HNH endonuclease [Deinococcus sp. SL84]
MARRNSFSTWPEAPSSEAAALTCALCEREVPELVQHHLIPIIAGKRKGIKPQDLPTVGLCPACQQYLHSTFSINELATRLNTLEALQADEQVQKFVKWVRKQPATKGVRAKGRE